MSAEYQQLDQEFRALTTLQEILYTTGIIQKEPAEVYPSFKNYAAKFAQSVATLAVREPNENAAFGIIVRGRFVIWAVATNCNYENPVVNTNESMDKDERSMSTLSWDEMSPGGVLAYMAKSRSEGTKDIMSFETHIRNILCLLAKIANYRNDDDAKNGFYFYIWSTTLSKACNILDFPSLVGSDGKKSPKYRLFMEDQRPWSAVNFTTKELIWKKDKEKKIRRFKDIIELYTWPDKIDKEIKDDDQHLYNTALKDLESGQFTLAVVNSYHMALRHVVYNIFVNLVEAKTNWSKSDIEENELWGCIIRMQRLNLLVHGMAPLFIEWTRAIDNVDSSEAVSTEPEDQNTDVVHLDEEPGELAGELDLHSAFEKGHIANISNTPPGAIQVASDPSNLRVAVREWLLLATRTHRAIAGLVQLAKHPHTKSEIAGLPYQFEVRDHSLKNKEMMSLEDVMKNSFSDNEQRTEWIKGIKQLVEKYPKKSKSMTVFGGAHHCEAACAVHLDKKRRDDNNGGEIYIGVSQRCCSSCQAILTEHDSIKWLGNSNRPRATALPEGIELERARTLVERLRNRVQKELDDNYGNLLSVLGQN